MRALDTPILNRLFEPISRILTPEVASGLVNFRFDRDVQADIDKLARKCNEGTLTDTERTAYEITSAPLISLPFSKPRHASFSSVPPVVDESLSQALGS